MRGKGSPLPLMEQNPFKHNTRPLHPGSFQSIGCILKQLSATGNPHSGTKGILLCSAMVSVLPLHIRAPEPQSCHSLTCPAHHSIPPAPLHVPTSDGSAFSLLAFIPCEPLPIYASLDTYIDIDLHMQVPISIYIYLFYTYIFIYAFNEVLCFQLLPSSSGIRSGTRASV